MDSGYDIVIFLFLATPKWESSIAFCSLGFFFCEFMLTRGGMKQNNKLTTWQSCCAKYLLLPLQM